MKTKPYMKDPEQETLFEFPCQFPIKVMGKAIDEFEQEVIQIMQRHIAEFEETSIKRRDSAKSNYAALTITITATSRKQLDAIYMDLTASELVIMAI